VTTDTTGFHTLMYHEILPRGELPAEGRAIEVRQGYQDTLPPPLFIEADAFAGQMTWLAENGFVTVTLGQVISFMEGREALPPQAVLITFDDLYQSVREHACPVLRSLGMKATGFVVGAWVYPQPRPYSRTSSRTLSWPDLQEMRDVFAYANHASALHTREPNGTAVVHAGRDAFLADVGAVDSQVDFPNVYAYPFGIYTDQTVKWLADAGMTLAFTTNPGYNDATTPRLRLHRTGVFRGTSLDQFATLLRSTP